MNKTRAFLAGLVGLAAVFALGGCPGGLPVDVIPGGTGDDVGLGTVASVQVLSPASDLAVAGGTPVEVNWAVVATTKFASIDVIFDLDQQPDNGNEIFAQRNITLGESSATVDTTNLDKATYFVGVVLREQGVVSEFGYAVGSVIINQRAKLTFSSPRDNFIFDRTLLITPQFEITWEVNDPDSTVHVDLFLDPDDVPNGNEVLLRESDSQTGGSFMFAFPTGQFDAGVYHILAVVTDGDDTASFYAPATIRLRSRIAGLIDLRNLDTGGAGVSGAVFEGFNPHDNAGSFVGGMRDLDRDGFGDFIILAQFGKPAFGVSIHRAGVGEAYLVYGRGNRYNGKINLNSTGTLFRGDVFTGVPQANDPIRPSRGITSFTMLSDWDRDGLREFAFGLPFTDSLAVGELAGGVGANYAAPLDVNGYFRSGAVVVASSIGLRPDLGYPGRQVINIAEFGTLAHKPIACFGCGDCPCPEGFYGPKAPNLTCESTYFHEHLVEISGTGLGSVRLGCRLSSNETLDFFGESIVAGDFDSIIMSAPNRDPGIATFTNFNTSTSIVGAGVVSIYYINVVNGFFPWNTAQAPGAVDGLWDGFPVEDPTFGNTLPHGGPYHYIVDDFRSFPTAVGFLMGSPGYWVDPDDSDNPCEARISGNSCVPSRTTRIWGGFEGARMGNVATVQDFNADGLQDILMGSPLSNNAAGATFIVLGRLRDLVMGGELAIEELGLPLDPGGTGDSRIFDGIRVVGGPNDRLGLSQASAGDFNNDGISDIVIGSPFVNNHKGGVAVFFGSREIINLTQTDIPFDEIPERGLGVIFEGEEVGDLAGARVANAGDIDGDGNTDILIAAPDRTVQADIDLDGVLDINRTECGVVYLIYGNSKLHGRYSLADIGTETLPGAVFVGRFSGDHLGAGLGEQGDRSHGMANAGDVDGDGRADLLLSAITASPRDRVAAGEAYLIYGQGD